MPREFEKRDGELGSLWSKQSHKGEYLTGEINGVKVVCFRVKSENPKAPTWRVLKSQPREDRPPRVDAPDSDDIGF